MPTLPALYISHGSPMTALTPGRVGERLAALATQLPRPRAIVMASAHWLTHQPAVGGHAQPPTIHDFGGFPQALFDLQYPAPGDPALAEDIAARLAAAGLPAQIDPRRGLDHGAWVPLRLLYPQADIPVVPLAIQPRLGPAHQFALGRALAPLRGQGVLLIGSGSITHNLHDAGSYAQGKDAPYVRPFIAWVEQRLQADDSAALLDYRQRAPYAAQAHPTDEHLQPLHFAMGAAGGEALGAQRIDAGIEAGFLAMDIYRFDGAARAG
ncbi:dioxygenase family protein [Stenotrophomonas rhizophila]|uniref:dioxygenase family protein n=1 Tax=Stenotrophomonas rhizophila TaxID=216778 RepID=UPI001E39CED6|nr:class III extradiol ring-cleavage dioxygenase [Stenotrophomonas rhizophila]MCC7634147.1 dioxygenase [Stenotrophomonas rhizophila]MCC7662843.1 dioxygenase [Stenotrophomonas rhizophila]